MDIVKEIKEGIKKTIDVVEDAVEKVVEKVEDVIEGDSKESKKKSKAKPKKKKKADKEKAEEETIQQEEAKDSETEPKGEKLEEAAKAESTEPVREKTLEERKKELLAKVAKLKGKIDITSTKELKEQVKAKKRADMLVPLEEYVKAGIYLGTRVVTPDMKPFVYRRRADGLAIFNTDLIDEKIKDAIEYLVKFDSKDIILVCKRQAGWKVAEMFGKLTGIRVFAKKYPAGVLTNTALPNFFETELTIVTDHWLDKNALKDTLNIRKNVLMICDTNNFSHGANQVIIGNNKSGRSLGLIFYLLTKGYCKAKDLDCDIPDLEWWTSEKEIGGAEYGV